MQPTALAKFSEFTDTFEGCTPYLYLDIFRLVTTARGCKVDSIAEVQRLDFMVGERFATQFEIMAAWRKVKNDTTLDPKYGGGQYATMTTIRMTQASIDMLTSQRLRSMEANIKQYLRNWGSLCADAQLLVMSMAWALGAAGLRDKFPKFCAAINSNDWVTAAAECKMDESHQTAKFHERNEANYILATNAGVVLSQQMDPTQLYYPMVLSG